MRPDKTRKHFAEICECIWNRIADMNDMDPSSEDAKSMYRMTARFVMFAWNTCNSAKTLLDAQRKVRRYAARHWEGHDAALMPLMDTIELKWREYREDKGFISRTDVDFENGTPRAVAFVKEDLLTDEGDKDGDLTEGLYEYPISLDTFRGMYTQAVWLSEVEYKKEVLDGVLKQYPMLEPLCQNANKCFAETEKHAFEYDDDEIPDYPGSVPELIIAIANIYSQTTSCPHFGPGKLEYINDAGKIIAKHFMKTGEPPFGGFPEPCLFGYIGGVIERLKLPKTKLKKTLETMFAWAMLLCEARTDQHPEQYEDSNEKEEEYDFNPMKLRALHLHIKLLGYKSTADVIVLEDTTFDKLSRIINILFRRTDEHLFRFECEDGFVTISRKEREEDKETMLADCCYVGHHLSKRTGAFFLYDYGDEWEHDITVKNISEANYREEYPKILRLTGEPPSQYADEDDEFDEGNDD